MTLKHRYQKSSAISGERSFLKRTGSTFVQRTTQIVLHGSFVHTVKNAFHLKRGVSFSRAIDFQPFPYHTATKLHLVERAVAHFCKVDVRSIRCQECLNELNSRADSTTPDLVIDWKSRS